MTTTTTTTTTRRSPARAVVVASFMTMLAISIPNAYGAAVPGVSAATGVDVATVGQLTTIHGVGAFAGLMLWVPVSRRVPTRTIVTTALAVLLVGALAIAVNPAAARQPTGPVAFAALAVAVAVVGVAFSTTIVATNSVLANRGGSASLLNAANGMYGIGAVVLPLVVGASDLRTATLLVAAVAAVTLPRLRAVPDLSDELRGSREDADAARRERRPDGDERSTRRVGRAARRLWRGNGSRPWVWVFGVAIGVEVGTAAWAAAHLVSVGVAEGRAAAGVAGFFAAFTFARFAMAWVGDRWSMRAVVVGSNLLAAAAALAATIVPLPTLAWTVVGLGVGPVFGTTLAWLTAATGDPDGTRRMNVGGAVGAIVLPGLIGLAVAAVGPSVIPWAVAAYAIAAAGLAATLPPADDQRPGAPGAATSTST